MNVKQYLVQMKPLVLCLLICLVNGVNALAGDSLVVQLNKKQLSYNDTLGFDCTLTGQQLKKTTNLTVNVMIEHLATGQTYQYRYPMLKGRLTAALVVSDTVPPGNYAVNFVLQRGLYGVFGHTENMAAKTLSYFVKLSDGGQVIHTTELDDNGEFYIPNLLFEDQAAIVFTSQQKNKKQVPVISIATPLDSAYTPLFTATQFISIGAATTVKKSDTAFYRFNNNKVQSGYLPNVTVVSVKKKIEDFDKHNSFGLFKSESRVFDGLNTDEISRWGDVETFLESQVPGLTVRRGVGSNPILYWRNEPVVIYIDEIRLDDCAAINVTPLEIAMIKVFNPPAPMNSALPNTMLQSDDCPLRAESRSFSGAIAIYTKRGEYSDAKGNRRNSFTIRGYTPILSSWK